MKKLFAAILIFCMALALFACTPKQAKIEKEENLELRKETIQVVPNNDAYIEKKQEERKEKWTKLISQSELLSALEDIGEKITALDKIELVTKNDYDAAASIIIGQKSLEAGRLFAQLDLPSTYVHSIQPTSNGFKLTGSFDHN